MKRKVLVYAVLLCIVLLQGCALDFLGNGTGPKDPIDSDEPYNASIWMYNNPNSYVGKYNGYEVGLINDGVSHGSVREIVGETLYGLYKKRTRVLFFERVYVFWSRGA